jgi:CRISPR-associated endonuclease/helicase Cas3
MTASLPEARQRAIEKVRPDLKPISGPVEFEILERYLISDSATEEDMWKAVDECVGNRGKVLWVRNRVEWANETYDACRKRYSEAAVDVYHSRFRYRDRSIRHRRVIDNFKSERDGAVLVATQVAEMSLDLSADLLITDIAPIPSLIQRMGRLNRRSTPDKKADPKPSIVRPLPQAGRNIALPYKDDEIETAARWIKSLIELDKPLSQHDLSETFAKFSDEREYDIAKAEERAVFFSGLWRTRPGQTRGEGHTISVILQSDLEKCDERDRRGEPTRDWLRNHEVPILFKQDAMRWDRVGTLRVAPTDSVEYDYNEKTEKGTGAKWRR